MSVRSEELRDRKRRLYVMRHGERCDFTFGKSWVDRCFDSSGKYTQCDINLPKNVLPRKSHKEYLLDSPLTEVGKFHSLATGEAFKRAGISIKHVYVSPSLRCVETAQGVINGMGNGAKMCIEPLAFEWCGWYKNEMPKWLTPNQLASAGFCVNASHRPMSPVSVLRTDESISAYYARCQKLAEEVLKNHEDEGGDVLIVAHAASLDTFTRGLRGLPPRSSQEMHQMLSKFTYNALCCCSHKWHAKWQLEKPPIPPLHGFDWNALS